MTRAADPTPNGVPRISGQDVGAGGHRLRVYTCGDAGHPAVVFVHGSGPGVSAPSNWEHLLPVFAAAGYFAIAPDVLGFGDSEHPDPAPSGGMVEYTDLRARSLVALLDALGIGKAHFVGNSMGGMITLRIAQIAPDRLAKMILMGSGGAPIRPTDDLMRLITFYDDPSPEAMADLLVRFVDNTGLFAGKLDEIAADRAAKANRPDVRRSHLATFDPRHGPVKYTEEDLASITHEALVLHGREDRMLPLQAGYYLAEHLPNAQLHVLPHAGHWIQIEQAGALRRAGEAVPRRVPLRHRAAVVRTAVLRGPHPRLEHGRPRRRVPTPRHRHLAVLDGGRGRDTAAAAGRYPDSGVAGRQRDDHGHPRRPPADGSGVQRAVAMRRRSAACPGGPQVALPPGRPWTPASPTRMPTRARCAAQPRARRWVAASAAGP